MQESDLQQVFANFGVVKEAKIIMNRETSQSRGFAFVTMENDDAADKAIAGLGGKEIGGRTIVVSVAIERAPRGNRDYQGGSRNN